MEIPLILVLDNLRSAHNVGAAFRLADAFSIKRIYLCGITPPPPHPAIRKTALGAENTVPFLHVQEVTTALREIQQIGYHLIAIEQTPQALPLYPLLSQRRGEPCALVFGHEVWGVSKEALSMVPTHLEIPQYGSKKSLNVATAMAIAIWEIRR